MAVQAQYPSNILLLNRNVQEGHDYSFQPQPTGAGGGIVLDQQNNNPLFYNNNGSSNNSSRKRGRQVSATKTGVAQNNNNVMNSTIFNFESQQPQLIELSQLQNHNQQQQQKQQQQNGVVYTGLRLSTFTDPQQQQQQLQRPNLHQNQNQNQNQHGSHNSSFISLLSQGFASQIKQQRDEIDQLIQAQVEQLRRTLAEKRQRHYRELLSAAEEAVAHRLREKDAEIEKATRRKAELEARAAQLAAEAQVWQAKARAQEEAAASLQAQLQQTMMASAGATAAVDDVSCAVEGQAEDAESAFVDPDRVEVVSSAAVRPKCRGCGRRVASVVVLPCRHLCICTECDAHFRACPVCLTMKDSTVEVFLS